MKKLLVLVLAACLSIGLLGGLTVASADEVYELNVSFAAPEFSTLGITAALDRIQEASEGRIKFNYYYSWSLSSVPTVIDDLASGVCDIAEVPINEHLNTFTYSNLITYTPFLPMKGMRDAALTFNELFNEWECLQNEYTSLGIHYWTNIPCPVYNIFTTADKAIKVPGDMAGLKLITSQGTAVKKPILTIGNTQTHVDFGMPLDDYMDEWFRQAPTHHCALSVGHNAGLFEQAADLLNVEHVRVGK